MAPGQGDVTRILADLHGPNRQEALDRLVSLVYSQLLAIAQSRLRYERPDHSLEASALVHEAYLRLLSGDYPTWNDRQHFYLPSRGNCPFAQWHNIGFLLLPYLLKCHNTHHLSFPFIFMCYTTWTNFTSDIHTIII